MSAAQHVARWDYVVVGAGSAGCVLAERLSRGGQNSVLVIEAGSRDVALMKPFGLSYYFDMSRFEWGYWSQPDATRNMRTDHWRRGRVVGGSGSINGMNYVRGARHDYDQWAALGNLGWSANDVMPLFRGLERCEPGFHSSPDFAIRGDSGKLSVREVRKVHRLTDAFIESAQAAGYQRARDYNGAAQEGLGYGQFNQRRGLRCSSADAFLKPSLKRHNLQLMTDALVHKVLVDHGRATGVRYECEGVIQEARSTNVILCAGAINTPQILMLSGIGDEADLTPHGIPVVADVPEVGKGMMEHPLIRMAYRVKEPSYSPTSGIWQKAGFLYKFLVSGQGPIATLTEALAFLRTSPSESVPDIQLHLSLAGIVHSQDASFYKGLKVLPFPSFSVSVNKSYPASRGQIRLASADPKAAPLIEPNLLSDSRDIETLVRGIAVVRRIVGARPIADMIVEEVEPGIRCDTPQALVDYCKSRTGLAYHPAGTCRMGIDARSVVTPDLQVRGIANLWVADASVMPTMISGNINAACMMIGEKLGLHLASNAGRAKPGDNLGRKAEVGVPRPAATAELRTLGAADDGA
jgi:choline dehydrogenase